MSQNVNEPVPGTGGVATATGPNPSAGVIFASQVRDATGASGGSASGVYNSQAFNNDTARGVQLNLVIAPTGAATGTVTLKLQVLDPVSNTVWTDLSGATTAAINGTGALTGTLLTVYPGVLTGASSANISLGPMWRAVVTVALAPLTFTVGGNYLL
jgi:hypothetical protein